MFGLIGVENIIGRCQLPLDIRKNIISIRHPVMKKEPESWAPFHIEIYLTEIISLQLQKLPDRYALPVRDL